MTHWCAVLILAASIASVLCQLPGCEDSSLCCDLGGWCGSGAYDSCNGTWDYQVPCSPTFRDCCLPDDFTLPPSPGPTDPPTQPPTTPPYTGPTTTPGPTPTPFEGCGRRPADSYIVGGVEAVPHSWPWMVSLQLDYFGWGDWRHHCGGSIVHPQWMVTAAHCIAKSGADGPQNFKVILGMHYKEEQRTGNEIEMPVETAIWHENYRTDIPGSPFDVALVKFVTPIDYNRYMSPVCLPTDRNQNFVDSECFITGWGLTRGTGNENVLNEVEINVITNGVCDNKWETGSGRVGLIKESHICAGNGVPGTCNGDSGGPLVCKEGGNWILAGATSFGAAGCEAENAPDVYTRISFYTDWINDKIQNN